MRALFVGLGSIGRRHLENLRRLGVSEFAAVRSNPDAPPVEGVHQFATLDQGLSWRPDGVLVCNPTSRHIAVALAAARRGCHLFIEKPLSDSANGVGELVAEIRARRLVALVGFNLRFNAGIQALKEVVASGRIGRPLSLHATVGQYLPDWHPNEDHRKGCSASRELGGGVIFDLVHELDLVRWLCGPVKAVTCVTGSVGELEIETEDVAEIILGFESGAIGSVHLDYLDRAYNRHCRVIGAQGSAVWDAAADLVRVYSAEEQVWSVAHRGPAERNEMYLGEMEHWLACIEGAETSRIPIEEGAEALAIALAAHQSARSGLAVRVETFSQALLERE